MPDVGEYYNANLANSIQFLVSFFNRRQWTNITFKKNAGTDAFNKLSVQLQQEDPTTDDNSSLDSGDAMYDVYQPRSSKIDDKKLLYVAFATIYSTI